MDDLLVTFDVDWAPDFAIDAVAETLLTHHVRATWFVTHRSAAIDRLRLHPDLFELGIHPNLLPGSTHGRTTADVFRHCLDLVPEAISMRTHALVQSAPLLDYVTTQTPIVADVSLLLLYAPDLRPVEYQRRGCTLLRVPFYWEDDDEVERTEPYWHLRPEAVATGGLKVFDFHPIHLYLNTTDMSRYTELKRRVGSLTETRPSDVDAFVRAGEGPRTVFTELVAHLARQDASSCIRDVYRRWQTTRDVRARAPVVAPAATTPTAR